MNPNPGFWLNFENFFFKGMLKIDYMSNKIINNIKLKLILGLQLVVIVYLLLSQDLI
jgi:hypothetical protein